MYAIIVLINNNQQFLLFQLLFHKSSKNGQFSICNRTIAHIIAHHSNPLFIGFFSKNVRCAIKIHVFYCREWIFTVFR
jgi:hypothetical protein